MLLLALTSQRVLHVHAEMTRLVHQGHVCGAILVGSGMLDRGDMPGKALDRSLVGQLLGRCLLACGREEEAEELFQRQLKVYESISRSFVRWNSTLDHGCLLLQLNRSGRAAENFCSVADDRQTPPELRAEAMVAAAMALHHAGECRTAQRVMNAAQQLGKSLPLQVAQGIDCVALELAALQQMRTGDGLEDHALSSAYREGASELAPSSQLVQQLGSAAQRAEADAPLVAQRLRQLACIINTSSDTNLAAAQMMQGLSWLRERRLAGFETGWRIESALILIGRGGLHMAHELLAPLVFNEQLLRCSRYALELQYCLAKLYTHQGRHADALRLYTQHSQEAVLTLKSDATRRKHASFLDSDEDRQSADAAQSRLPLRYRRAYQYILDHLGDERLSVHQVALHIGVTERALQLAFRNHLGLTPAELIRTRRMERIREDLRTHAGEHAVLDLAARWGVKNRSTLVHNYRARFAETPTQTLKGGLAQQVDL